MRRRSFLVLAGLAGCNGGGDTDGGNGAYGALPEPVVTWLSQGDGPENELPLEPMLIGAGSLSPWPVRWASEIDAGRDTLGVFESDLGEEGEGMGLFRAAREGVVVHALDDPLDPEALPVLLVPNTVRVGMDWTSDYGDGNFNHETVIAHSRVMTPIGPVEAWGIAEEFAGSAFPKVRWYGEGIGRIGTNESVTWDPALAYTDLVVPDESLPSVQAAIDPVVLEPLLDPFGHPVEIGPRSRLRAMTGAFRHGVTWLYFRTGDPFEQAEPTWYGGDSPEGGRCMSLAPGFSLVGPGEDPNCPNAPSVGCRQLGYYYTSVVCDASADVIPSSGEFLPDSDQISLAYLSGPYSYNMWDLEETDPSGQIGNAGFAEEAARVAAQRRRVVYTWATPAGVSCLLARGDEYYSIVDGEGACTGAEPTAPVMARTPYRVYNRLRYDLTSFDVFGPTHVDGEVPFTLGFVAADGVVFQFTVEPDGRIDGLAPAGVMPGTARMFADDDGRSLYSITNDFRIFRTRVDGDDVVIESLGDVRIDDRVTAAYHPVAVMPDPANPGEYVVAVEAQLPLDQYGYAIGVSAFPTGLYHAHLEREPVRVVSPATLAVGAAIENGALRVCWPKTDEPFDASGWTVAGKPPVLVLGPSEKDPSCAVVVPDPVVDPAWAGAENAIHGPIPGAGPVRLGIPAARTLDAPLLGAVAVLKDGTAFEVDGWQLDEHGVVYGREPGVSGVLAPRALDFGGYGFWEGNRNRGGGLTAPCEAACDYGGAVVGGGVLLLDGNLPLWVGAHVVRPDGTSVVVPAAQWARVGPVPSSVALEDGRICVVGAQVSCVDASGVETIATGVSDNLQRPGEYDDVFWPLPDGSLVLRSMVATLRFDPVAMTVTELDPRDVVGMATSADGEVYGIVGTHPDNFSGAFQVVRITAAGFEEVSPVYAGDYNIAGNAAVVPLADQLMVRAANVWYRLERP